MPNHVTSKVRVTGPAAQREAFAKECFTDVGFDFETILPMPSHLRETESSSHVELGFSLLGVPEKYFPQSPEEARRRFTPENADAVVAATLKSVECMLRYGFRDWYEWSVARWGTKWNAYNSTLETGADDLLLTFNTAWSFPRPIFEALAAKYPSLTFECVCFDEGWNFAGQGLFGAGAEARPFQQCDATDELYERVYGHAPAHDEDAE